MSLDGVWKREGQASALEAQGGSREAEVAGPRRIWGSEECKESHVCGGD